MNIFKNESNNDLEANDYSVETMEKKRMLDKSKTIENLIAKEGSNVLPAATDIERADFKDRNVNFLNLQANQTETAMGSYPQNMKNQKMEELQKKQGSKIQPLPQLISTVQMSDIKSSQGQILLKNQKPRVEIQSAKQRNAEIEEYNPDQYSHLYHLRNLKNIDKNDCYGTELDRIPIIDNFDKDLKSRLSKVDKGGLNTDTTIQNHICKDILYTIANKLYKSHNDQKEIINIQTIAVIQHINEGNFIQKKKVMESVLWDQCDVHNFYRSAQPAIIQGHKMYWVSFEQLQKDGDIGKARFKIYQYDFELPEQEPEAIFTRDEPWFKGAELYAEENQKYDQAPAELDVKQQFKCDQDQDDLIEQQEEQLENKEQPVVDKDEGLEHINDWLYVCQSMLSIYSPDEDDLKKDEEQERKWNDNGHSLEEIFLKKQQRFRQRTYITIRYRTKTKGEIDSSFKVKEMSPSKRFASSFVGSKRSQEYERQFKFQFAYKIFSMNDFQTGSKHIQKHSLNGFSFDFQNADFFPMIQFVRADRLYYVVLKKQIEYSYMDIQEKTLSLLETINQYMIDESTVKVAKQFFYWPYSIYNVSHRDNQQSLIHLEVLEDPEVYIEAKNKDLGEVQNANKEKHIKFYNEVAIHFQMGLKKNPQSLPESMNVVYDIRQSCPLVYLITASENEIQVKVLKVRGDFIREFRQTGLHDHYFMMKKIIEDMKNKNLNRHARKVELSKLSYNLYGHKIAPNKDIWIELKGLKGKEENGVFIQIHFERPGQNEIVVSQLIQTPFTAENFEQACLCLGPEDKEPPRDGWKTIMFFAAVLDSTNQISQVYEFKLQYNIKFSGDSRIMQNSDKVNPLKYIEFMKNCHNIVILELEGINLIVLKEQYKFNEERQILLRPWFGDEQKKEYTPRDCSKQNEIKGVDWIQDGNYAVQIRNHRSTYFQIKSDLAKNYYQKYYFRNTKEDTYPDHPDLIHIQTHLGGEGDEMLDLKQDPFAGYHQVISAIDRNNLSFHKYMSDPKSSCFGVHPFRIYQLFEWKRHQNGFNLFDRAVLLKNQIRTISTMVPVDFQNMLNDFSKIDVLQCAETLNCQSECDFLLKNPAQLTHNMENNKDDKGKLTALIRGFINQMEDGVQKSVIESLDDLGYWRRHQEIVSSLYYSNSLMRCFMQEQPRIQSAKLLISHMMKKKMTLDERSIIMTSLPKLLDCKFEPFSFQGLSDFFKWHKHNDSKGIDDQKISFCQSLETNPKIILNSERQEIEHIIQCNQVVNSSREFKKNAAFFIKEIGYDKIDTTVMNTPVEHCIIDFHPLFL